MRQESKTDVNNAQGPEDIIFSERANGRAVPRGDSNKQIRASKKLLKGVGQVTLPGKIALQ